MADGCSSRGLELDLAVAGLARSGSTACPSFLGRVMWSCLTLLSPIRPLRMLAGCKLL